MNYILLGVLVFVIGVVTFIAVPIVRSMRQEAVESRRAKRIWNRPIRHYFPSRKTRKFIKLLGSGKATAEQVEEALRRGADPNAPDRDGRTPLATAAARCSPEVITALLQAGADIHHKMRHWRLLPFIVTAALNPDPEVLAVLVRAGADPNQRDGYGYPPLVSWSRWARWACQGRLSEEIHLWVVSNLLKAGANPVDVDVPYPSVRNLLRLEAERGQEFTTDEEVAKLIKGDGTL